MADNPLKFLLAQLPAYVPPDRLAQLLADFEVHKAAYARQSKIREVERRIANLQRRPHEAVTLANWQAKLAVLKAQEKAS